MIKISCRDPLNASKIDRDGIAHDGGISYHKLAKDSKGIAVIYLHGYNNTQTEADRTFNTIGSAIKDLSRAHFAFHWPSQGKLFKYWVDRRKAKKAAKILGKFVQRLRGCGFTKIHFWGHSMGCRVIFEYLYKHAEASHKISNVALCGADVARRKLKPRKKYGAKVAVLIDKLIVYYSPDDRVLDWIAEKYAPSMRLGAKGLPKKHPDKYIQIPAKLHAPKGTKVRHSYYINTYGFIRLSVKELL